jgi:hypothetical protein
MLPPSALRDATRFADLGSLEIVRDCRAFHPGWELYPEWSIHGRTVT